MMLATPILSPKTAVALLKSDLSRAEALVKANRAKNRSLANIKLLLNYQRQWIKAGFSQQVCIAEKSRRVGLSWSDAVISVLKAAKNKKGTNTYYIGYNFEMTAQYIEDCAFWAKAFNIVGLKIKQRIIHDEHKDILVSRIKFASGHKIVALSSKPKNLRSKKGDLVLDEFAFHEYAYDLLKAALALIMWGGSIRIISTHNGVDSYFNEIINDVRKGVVPYYLQKVTFQQAVKEGLYKRICLVNGEEWTLEKEFEWIKKIYAFYGSGADEELDTVPSEGRFAGQIYDRNWFKLLKELPSDPWIKVRAWDLAGTKNEPLESHFFTVGVLLYLVDDKIIVADWIYRQCSISTGDALIEETTIADGFDVSCILEQEPGDTGERYVVSMQERLAGYDIIGIRPMGNKVIRAIQAAQEARRGNIYLLEAPWNEKFIQTLHKVQDKPTPLVTDTSDALSLGVKAVKNLINPLYGT